MNPARDASEFKAETIRGARGFVRVGRTHGGQWWFLDPSDRPFFSRGVTSIGRTRSAGSRQTALPPNESRLQNASTLAFLRSWNVNTVGPWGIPAGFDPGYFRVELLDFRKALPEATIRLGGAVLPDVYDPNWAMACDAVAARRCLPLSENPSVLGYFTDHELGWGQPDGEPSRLQMRPDAGGPKPGVRPSLLQICLSLDPSHAAYHAGWEFALSSHGGDLASLSRSWEIPLKNKEVLRQLTRADTPLIAARHCADNDRFSREFARRYFSTCAAAIRKYDSHHLILGCRFAGMPGAAVLSECAPPHVDAISLDDSRDTPGPRLEACSGQGGHPVLVGGFTWVNDYFITRPSPGEPPGFSRLERMLSKGRAALEAIVSHPAAVGYSWHPWSDPNDRRPPFGEGLVHVDGSEAAEHTELLSSINARADQLRGPARPL